LVVTLVAAAAATVRAGDDMLLLRPCLLWTNGDIIIVSPVMMWYGECLHGENRSGNQRWWTFALSSQSGIILEELSEWVASETPFVRSAWTRTPCAGKGAYNSKGQDENNTDFASKWWWCCCLLLVSFVFWPHIIGSYWSDLRLREQMTTTKGYSSPPRSVENDAWRRKDDSTTPSNCRSKTCFPHPHGITLP
jgi:hypothetical protein